MALQEQRSGNLQTAVDIYDLVLATICDCAEIHNNRGVVLQRIERLAEALASYDRAIALKPDCANAHYNRGSVLKQMQRYDDVLSGYDRAIALQPGHANAYIDRGVILQELKRYNARSLFHLTIHAINNPSFIPHFNSPFTCRSSSLRQLIMWSNCAESSHAGWYPTWRARQEKWSDTNRIERIRMPKGITDPPKAAGRSANVALREVAFILNKPGAESVYLCGDFNEWFTPGLPMVPKAEGRLWERRLLLPPGRYEYKFIVDGIWTHNSNAGKNVLNGFGSLNSVVEVRP